MKLAFSKGNNIAETASEKGFFVALAKFLLIGECKVSGSLQCNMRWKTSVIVFTRLHFLARCCLNLLNILFDDSEHSSLNHSIGSGKCLITSTPCSKTLWMDGERRYQLRIDQFSINTYVPFESHLSPVWVRVPLVSHLRLIRVLFKLIQVPFESHSSPNLVPFESHSSPI